MLLLLHLGLESITEVDTDLTEKIVSFKVTLSNDSVLCVYVPSEYSTREQLTRERFFKGLKIYMEKNEGNDNKIILEEFNCTMNKMDRDGKNNTKTLWMLFQLLCPVEARPV